MDPSIIITKLLDWGPGGLLAALFIWLWFKERDRVEDRDKTITALQDKRVTETRDDVGKMTAALVGSTEAIETNTGSITALKSLVEITSRGGAPR